ncbi:MAG: sugar phosphate isomerase/epimerase, partial [Mesorhizobium sp.]
FSESPEAVYRDGYNHIRSGWKKAGALNAAGPSSQAI